MSFEFGFKRLDIRMEFVPRINSPESKRVLTISCSYSYLFGHSREQSRAHRRLARKIIVALVVVAGLTFCDLQVWRAPLVSNLSGTEICFKNRRISRKHFTYPLLKPWVFEAMLTMMKLSYLGMMLLDAFHWRQNLLKHCAKLDF